MIESDGDDDRIGVTPPNASGAPIEHLLIEQSRLPIDKPVYVRAGERELAVVRRTDGTVIAMDNACPHAGGNLGGGTIVNDAIVCPWHQWTFNLSDGRCTHAPTVRVRQYATVIRNGVVFCRL